MAVLRSLRCSFGPGNVVVDLHVELLGLLGGEQTVGHVAGDDLLDVCGGLDGIHGGYLPFSGGNEGARKQEPHGGGSLGRVS